MNRILSTLWAIASQRPSYPHYATIPAVQTQPTLCVRRIRSQFSHALAAQEWLVTDLLPFRESPPISTIIPPTPHFVDGAIIRLLRTDLMDLSIPEAWATIACKLESDSPWYLLFEVTLNQPGPNAIIRVPLPLSGFSTLGKLLHIATNFWKAAGYVYINLWYNADQTHTARPRSPLTIKVDIVKEVFREPGTESATNPTPSKDGIKRRRG
ncbi:hypothetical protein DXG01_013677 [Tephrocybe rancida]|nr:hypothetical protein DXG01_013677 [Tephrocybe rancida]